MKRRFVTILTVCAMLLCGIGLVSVPSPADAAKNVCDDADATMKEVLGCKDEQKKATVGTVINAWIAVVLSFVGVAAIVMIVIGGVFYTKSMGDPGKAKRARDTIIYGVVGLIVALLAYAIVALVTENIGVSGKL